MNVNKMTKDKLLFICAANLCRSPTDVEPNSKLCPICYQPYNKCVCENNAKFEYEQEQERLRMEVEMEEEQRLSDENAEEYWSGFK